MSDPATRLREAQKQAALAREQLDPESPEWDYAQGAAANAESARVLLEGAEILTGDTDAEHES